MPTSISLPLFYHFAYIYKEIRLYNFTNMLVNKLLRDLKKNRRYLTEATIFNEEEDPMYNEYEDGGYDDYDSYGDEYDEDPREGPGGKHELCPLPGLRQACGGVRGKPRGGNRFPLRHPGAGPAAHQPEAGRRLRRGAHRAF